MATKKSIAIRNEQALGRIEESAAALSQALSLDAPDLRPHRRDADIGRAAQLAAIADLLEDALANLPEPQAPVLADVIAAATTEELEAIPGIGAATAKRIKEGAAPA